MNEVHEQVKKLAELIVLTDITDIQSLSDLHSAFDNLAVDADKNSLPDITSAARICSGIVESIVLGEVKSLSDAYQTLNDTVSSIQMFFENKSGELNVPEALKDYAVSSASAPVKPKAETAKKKNTSGDAIDASQLNIQLSESEKLREAILASTAATMTADPDLLVDFINESVEHLDSCNEHLLTLEASPEDYDSLNAIFRAFHTIKGVASFLNLNEIRKLSHQTENLFDKARAGSLALSGEAMDITFEAVDMMRNMIDDLSRSVSEGKPVSTVKSLDRILKSLEMFLGSDKAVSPAPVQHNENKKTKSSSKRIAKDFLDKKIDLNETQDFMLPKEMFSSELPAFIDEISEHIELSEENLLKIEHDPHDKEILNSLFRSFHTIKGSSALIGIVAIEKLAHRAETLLDRARNGKILLEGEALDLVFNCLDILKYILEIMKGSVLKGEDKFVVPEFKDLLEKIDDFLKKNNQKLEPQDTLPSPSATQSIRNNVPEKVPASLSSTQSIRNTVPAKTGADKDSGTDNNDGSSKKAMLKEVVKVDADRLDRLVDLIGELVIAETMVTQSPEIKQVGSQRLFQNISHLDKITRELQAMGTYLRMVPLHATFQKMARLVRDLSKKLGKDIEFSMSGEDTELDKTVVDRIGDPLVHMVRNAVDHGVEKTPADRAKASKAPKARIELRAYHKGGNIFIEVEDDGRGLDKKAIFNKAVERGIAAPDAQMDENDIYNLVFAPGFSTAENVTEVSGRGVGMDVVRRNIESLRGQVDIRSEFGKGSVFCIKLPLTMAIIDGMVVNVKDERYIIPTLSIVMSVRVNRKEIKTVQKKGEMLSIQGELIPIFHLENVFDIEKEESSKDDMLVVIVEDANRKTGIVVDELLGQQQIVIKNLGEYLKGVPGIAGGAIMPDGYVGLILDVGNLVKLANATI